MPNINTESVDGVLKIYLKDIRLSEDGLVEEVGTELNTLVNQSQDRKMMVNLRDVGFMNSSMIGKLVRLNQRCREEEIDLRFCEMNANLLEVFELMQLPRIMNIHSDEESAIAAFSGSAS